MNKLMKQINFATNLINIFSDYAGKLDEYFKDDQNKKEHLELYTYYQDLNIELRNLKKGFEK